MTDLAEVLELQGKHEQAAEGIRKALDLHERKGNAPRSRSNAQSAQRALAFDSTDLNPSNPSRRFRGNKGQPNPPRRAEIKTGVERPANLLKTCLSPDRPRPTETKQGNLGSVVPNPDAGLKPRRSSY